jgi:hypothetical protein
MNYMIRKPSENNSKLGRRVEEVSQKKKHDRSMFWAIGLKQALYTLLSPFCFGNNSKQQ